MQSRSIGPFQVSAIGLGCMNVSAGYGPADERQSARLLHEALDLGYRFLDTASLYGHGHNETLIGKTLKDRRDQYILASKCGLRRGPDGKSISDGRPEIIRQTCEQSLQRLQTDVIDLYYLHRIDPSVAVEESVGALAELVWEGKIRAIGLSEICVETLRRAHEEHPITAVQSEYSLWSRTPERGMLANCEELGVGFVPFSPLARGFLAGSACDVSQLAADDIRATIARPRFEPENFSRNSKLLPAWNGIAAELDCTPAQLALAWLLARSSETLVPIPGTRSIDHLRENAGAAAIALEPRVIDTLDELINEDTVLGSRYTAGLMASIDSERDP